MNRFSLQGRNAIVIEGGDGLARAIALGLADAGANVALTYWADEDTAQTAAREIEARGRLAIALRADRAETHAIAAAAKEARGALGPLSVLIDDARIGKTAMARRTAEILLPLLAESGNGAIVHIAMLGEHHDGSRAEILALTREMAEAAAARGVRANALAVGTLQSGLGEAALSSALDETGRTILLKRLGMAEEVADAAVFLASDAASYITAAVLDVDGGFSG